jgi:hypothetical protein
VGIVREISCGIPFEEHSPHQASVLGALAQHMKGGRVQEGFYIFQPDLQIGGRIEHTRMCHDPQELVNANPW